MMKTSCEREALMLRVQSYGFAVYEAVLYLDTHPCDPVALGEIEEFKRLYHMAVMEYTERYGPLTAQAPCTGENSWAWINCPWPWEWR